ncbi:MAG: epoxyqueuosine reductase [Chloroflexota bacterium]
MQTVTQPHQDLRTWITAVVQAFCAGPENSLHDATNERAWDEPLIGFSTGDDPLYELYKTVVGPFHWTPCEIFRATFPDTTVQPADLTVVSWVLPQTAATRADNRRQSLYPAERWARSRIYGEQFNERLRQHLAATLNASGYPAVAPFLSPQWQRRDSERFGYASTWSERHAAHACGLGTFGLCDGLITPKGKAVRVGSVVVQLQVLPTARPYRDHRAYCLFFSQGACTACIDRCPAGAISEAGHDKALCRQHLQATEAYVQTSYGFEGYGCGLCQTGVPCESGVPTVAGPTRT